MKGLLTILTIAFAVVASQVGAQQFVRLAAVDLDLLTDPLDAIESLLTEINEDLLPDAVLNDPAIPTGPQVMLKAYNFTPGTAAPHLVDTVGDAMQFAGSRYGIQFEMLTNADGSKTPFVEEDVAEDAGGGDLMVKIACLLDTTLNARSGAEGDYEQCHLNGNGALWVSDVNTVPFLANLVAHDAADAGNPLKIGFKATTSIVGQTPVANNDRTDGFAGIDGIALSRPHANLEDRVSAVVGVTDGSSTSLVAAQGSGVRFCAVTFIVSNSSATNVTVDIRDGTAGSVLATMPAKADMGGAVVPLQVPICTTANTALAMDPSAAASTVTVTAVGFKTEL